MATLMYVEKMFIGCIGGSSLLSVVVIFDVFVVEESKHW